MFLYYLQRVPRAALILAVLTVLGFASGWVPDDPTDMPLAVAIHEGHEPAEDGSPGGAWHAEARR